MNPAKIVMRLSDFELCRQDVDKHAKEGNETGQSLIGVIHPNGVYEVTRTVLGGDRASRGPVSFSTDPDVVKAALEEEMVLDNKSRYLIDMHSHPWPTPPHPSSIDVRQLEESRKTRPWFAIAVHNLSETKFFGLDDGGRPLEIPYQIVPDKFDGKNLLSRISQLTDHSLLQKKRVAVIGCGSLGSAAIIGLAGTGLRNFLLADMDELADVNLIRHIGGLSDLGRNKTEVSKDYIESHNPLAAVKTVEDDLIKNRELLRAIVEWADIVVASSGNPELNYQINIACVEMKKPAVYAGIYDKAESAYVFATNGSSDACFDCIFEMSSVAIDQGYIARKYGLEDGELHQAQGMFCDIVIPAQIMVKMALDVMLDRKRDFNLAMYYSDPSIKRLSVSKRKLCPTCDYDAWLANQEQQLMDARLESLWRWLEAV